MVKHKDYYINIPKALRQQTLDNWMFAFVLGVRTALPSVTISNAVSIFMQKFNLTEDEYPLDSAVVIYNRCMNNWHDYEKNIEKNLTNGSE